MDHRTPIDEKAAPSDTRSKAASGSEAGVARRLFGGRYREEQVLRKGREAETLLGVDSRTSRAVVIKLVPSDGISAGVEMRLQHEATVLQDIEGPRWLAPLLDVGRQGLSFYLITPLVPGVPLDARLRGGPLSLDETLVVGRCVLSALSQAHAYRVLHRGLKPSNVIVEGTPIHQATLVDFGSAYSHQLDASSRNHPPDAARYISPEQAGLLDLDVDWTSDLYCAGILLFECLAGRPPFDGRNIGEVLQRHMTMRPTELCSLGLPIPRVLDELVQRLLRKDPRERYQSAEAVLSDLEMIADALARGVKEPAFVVGLRDRRRTLTEPAFVGRDIELAELNHALTQARLGRGGLVLLESESGGGKSRLLAEFARQAGREGAWVLRGNALDQVAQRPFQVLDGVGAEIISATGQEPQLAAAIHKRLGEQCEAVAAVLPELADALGWTHSNLLGPEAFGETRSLQALAALVGALEAAGRPVVVLLDDCQWADELSLRFLKHWQQSVLSGEGGSHTVMVLAFRSEEAPETHLLRHLPSPTGLRLPPFESKDVRRLAESMAGPLPEEALRAVEQFSGGSPFMASAVLRGLVECGALVAETGQWRIDEMAMKDVQSSRHAAAFLARRLAWLPAETLEVLKVGAVLGREFDAALASALAGPLCPSPFSALEAARARHLVWTRPDGTQYLFVHDKVRETLLEWLSEEERRRLHLLAAEHIKQREPDKIFDLAYHFDAGGETSAAFPYAIRAAEEARAMHSLEIAEQIYRIALRGMGAADAATRYRVTEGLGDVLMLRGRYDAAEEMFAQAKRTAAEMPEQNLVKAQIEGKLGELAFKRGDMQNAAAAIEQGLRELGHWIPRPNDSLLFPILREVAVQTVHTLFPRFFVGRRRLNHPERERDLLAARLYSRLCHAYWFARGKEPTLWGHLRNLNIAERYAPSLELAHAYSEHSPAMTLLPWYRRAEQYARRSLGIREELGGVWERAQSLHYIGLVYYASSRFDECIKYCREAVRLFERTGDYWELDIARYQIAASLYHQGDLAGALAEAKRLHETGLEVGDTQASGISLDVWSWASGGKVPEEDLKIELARPRADAQATAQVLVAQAVRLLGLNRPTEAVEVLQNAVAIVDKSGVINAWDAPVFPWLVTAMRRQAEALRQLTPVQKQALLRQAERFGRRALAVTRKFQNDLAQTLRELGLLAAMRGKLTRARRLFDESMSVARRQGAQWEYAQTQRCRGQVGREVGWPDASRDLEGAESAVAERETETKVDDDPASFLPVRPATLSLVDRFDTVLEWGRRIASELSREAIFRETRTAALRLLRGEECEIIACVLANDAPAPGLLGGLYGRLAEHAVREKRPIAFTDSPGAEANEILDPLGVRSAMAAPILVRGRITACLCVIHSHVAGLFGEDEMRLAEFIATIAGAALENADNFAELEQLTRSLEQRVRDRTAEVETRSQALAASNEELQQFAYVTSHDLQEPLRTLMSYCQLLQRRYSDQLDPKAQELLTFAVDAAQRMRKLIQDLLTYSRVGTHGKEFQPTDCAEIVNLALANLRRALEEANARVTYDDLPVVQGDPTQLLQLFQNLIGNAVKFRGPQQPEIHVGTSRQEGHWLFSVRDNGIGIQPENLERVFLIFQRLHTREQYEGTGIGLAVCRKTVERHGGRIWTESVFGQGCTFYFTLPTAGAPARAM